MRSRPLHTVKHCLHFGSTGHSIAIALSLDDADASHKHWKVTTCLYRTRRNFQECNGIITVLDMPMFVKIVVTKDPDR